MKIIHTGLKALSISSILFFVGLYTFYLAMVARDFKAVDISFFRERTINLMTISIYSLIGGIIVYLILAFKKYRVQKFYLWLLGIAILSWIIVLFFDPGGIYDWFMD